MFSILEWLCVQMMEVEVFKQIGAEKYEQRRKRVRHSCGFRPWRLDNRMGTIYLMAPKVRSGDYIPFFVTELR